MFDWLGDIFNSDTFDTLKGGFDTIQKGAQAVSPFVQGGLGLINGLDSMSRARNYASQNAQTAGDLAALFAPNSPYAQELRQQLERRDAASGRRSQYGTRETELMAALARQQAGTLGSPQYQRLLAGANQSPYGGLMGSLGNLFSFRDKNGNFKTPPGTSKAIGYLADSLFKPTADVSIAGLGGADSALGATYGADMGVPDVLGSLSGNNSMLPTYDQAGGPQGTGVFDSISPLTGDLGISQALGGAGSALSGMGAGSLSGTVGGADALGSLFGGTGFLPSYGSLAGSEGALGAGLLGGAESGAAGGLFGTGFGMANIAALPFGLAIGGMLNGIFGPSDGPGYSARDVANTYANNTGSYQVSPEAFGFLNGNNSGIDLSQFTPDSYGGSGNIPMYSAWKLANSFGDWMNQPGVQDYYNNAVANYGKGAKTGWDMNHIYYNQDSPLLSAYMYSKYGAPNQTQTNQGLGGYSDDQYAGARDYFQGMGMSLQNQFEGDTWKDAGG